MADKMDAAVASMVANLQVKTGKSLEQWVALAKKCGKAKHGEIVKALKADHGLTHGYANLVAHEMLSGFTQPRADGGDSLINAQYAGDKAALKPIYDKLIEAVKKFGADVEISPKKTYVSLRRNKQFGLIQPTTRTRVDVGIKLKGEKPAGRLEASGSFNAMVSHRVKVESVTEANAELIQWLKRAYEQA